MNQSKLSPFIGYWSDKGKTRKENEDSFFVPSLAQAVQTKGYLCVVADGMGGHAKGEVASAMATRSITQQYYADPNPDPEQALCHAIQVANSEIYSAAQEPGANGMGTTIVAAVAVGSRVVVANVGDSRAYLISQGTAIQITRDHSWVQENVEGGALTEEQARVHANRNVITRAVGTQSQVVVDTFTPAAETGDWILLCSDGLSGLVRPDEMARAVTQLPPQAAAKQLVDLANHRGGFDNSTVVILPIGAVNVTLPVMRKKSSVWPVVIGAIAMIALITLASLLFVIEQDNLAEQTRGVLQAQSAQSTQTVMALAVAKTPTSAAQPTEARAITTPTAMITPTRETFNPPLAPTATVPPLAPVIAPVLSVTPAPSATASPTPTPSIPPVGKTAVLFPTPDPKASQPGDLIHPAEPIAKLIELFSLSEKPTSREFYERHWNEIHCESPSDKDENCVRNTIRIAWSELKPKPLAEVASNPGNLVWLTVFLNDGSLSISGLDKFKTYHGQWVLVRGKARPELVRFDVEPADFIFVYNYDPVNYNGAYAQPYEFRKK